MPKKNPKKNKEKKSISILNEIDNSLNRTYRDLMEEIQEIQLELNLADSEALIKERKKMKKRGNYDFSSSNRIEARKKAVKKMEETNIFKRIEEIFSDISPIIIVFARLVAALILAILSLDPIKKWISPITMQTMDKIYNTAMSIC